MNFHPYSAIVIFGSKTILYFIFPLIPFSFSKTLAKQDEREKDELSECYKQLEENFIP